jgi:hypothetical protein
MNLPGKRRIGSRLVLLLAIGCWASAASYCEAQDWPQFQHNAAHHGRAATPVKPPFQLRWVWYGPGNVARGGRPFPEGQAPRPPTGTTAKLSFTMQPVVADRRVFFGDLEGRVVCLDSRRGDEIWIRCLPAALLHTFAVFQGDDPSDHVVIAACQDGVVYGMDCGDGRVRWRVRGDRPFVTAVTLHQGTAYVGGLDGVMYAVDAVTGETKWRYQAGAPIRQPCAVAAGRVFFGSENMLFHAVDAATGRPLWRTRQGMFTGQSFRNTWPVVAGDKVMTFQVLVDGQSEFVMESLLFNATPGDHRGKRLEDWPVEREAILDWLAGDMTWAVDCQKSWQDHPGQLRGERNISFAGTNRRKTFYVMVTRGDGQGGAVEPYQVPMGVVGGTGNANVGPALDAQGRPLLWWRVSARSVMTGSGFGTAFCPDLSALDLRTGDRVILPTTRDIHAGGPGIELDNHHVLTTAGEYVYYFNPFRQARWVRLDGKTNPTGRISAVYGQHDGGGWSADVVYYPTKGEAGPRARHMFDSHGAARTALVIADGALLANEIDLRAVTCYEPQGDRQIGVGRPSPPPLPRDRATRVGDRLPLNRPCAQRAAAAPATGPTPQQAISSRPAEPAASTPPPDRPATPGDFIWQRQTVTDIPDSETIARLRRMLATHVGAMINAGHLKPYYCKRGENNPRWYFTNPGDTVWALGRAHGHLPASLQAAVRGYLQREMESYPPLSDAISTPDDEGTSRMDFDVPRHLREFEPEFYRDLPRVHNLYAVWLYTNATGDADYARRHWTSAATLAQRHREDFRAYAGGAAGAIAWARLAALVGDGQAVSAAEACALQALAALQNEPAMRQPMANRYGFRESWHQPYHLFGFHLLQLSPEVARYIRHHAAPRESIGQLVDAGVDHWPMWFVSQASAFSRYYGESHALSPLFSAMIYPVKALVQQSDPAQLRGWVDAEDSPRGDLFFIERLVLAIEAHGKVQWTDVRRPR